MGYGGIRAAASAAAMLSMVVSALPAAGNSMGGDAVTLRLGTFESEVDSNGVAFGPKTFVEQLEQLSGGQIDVEIVPGVGDGAPDAESQLVAAIAAGDVDGGWPTVRSFAGAGIAGLGAIEAPLTLTSYDAVRDLVSGPAADTALALLDGSGMTGLGLAVGPLRRPFSAVGPLLGPEDWQGIAFRSFNSPVQSDTYRALGADPQMALFDWIDRVAEGTLAGSEFDVFQYERNGYTDLTPDVTGNVVLWPKVYVLTLNQGTFDRLTPEQQDWVRQAAQLAVEASVAGTYDEAAAAAGMCAAGVRFPQASDAQLDALRAAVHPVIDALAADPVSGPLLGQVQAIAAEHPAPEAVAAPAGCHGPAPTEGPPATTSALPDGIYRQQVTLADVQQAGVSNNQGWTGVWTLTITDGMYSVTCRFVGEPVRDCGNSGVEDVVLDAGYVKGEDGVVWFVGDGRVMHERNGCALPPSATDPGHCYMLDPYWARWEDDGDQIRFVDADPGAVGLTLAPWVRLD